MLIKMSKFTLFFLIVCNVFIRYAGLFVTKIIGAFEFYMFHFAYYLVNSQKQKNDKVSSKFTLQPVGREWVYDNFE